MLTLYAKYKELPATNGGSGKAESERVERSGRGRAHRDRALNTPSSKIDWTDLSVEIAPRSRRPSLPSNT